MAFILILAILMAPPVAQQSEPEEQLPPVVEEKLPSSPQPVEKLEKTIPILMGDQVVEMTETDYLKGVLYGEMPASFPMEALKAQAVAARTFLYRQQEHPKHENAMACTDSTCCQAYKPVDDQWDAVIEQAVMETAGQVMTYEGQLIEAVYFSCSGGQTEEAVAVWGGDVPYLQSVESPGEEESQKFQQKTEISQEIWKATLEEKCPGISLGSLPELWVGTYIYTAGGGVEQVNIGGKWISGTDLRAWFALPSTNFTIQVGEPMVVTTLGYGHRVGMSQYGAKAMAEQGSTYEEILSHYYIGVQLSDCRDMACHVRN